MGKEPFRGFKNMFASRGYNLAEMIKTGISLFFVLFSFGYHTVAKGSGAGEALMGAAGIIGATGQMVSAGIQAQADVSIAKTNADASIKMSEITADNSKYLADSQERTNFFQSMVAMSINKQNNEAQTERLSMQLQEIAANRTMQYQLESEKRKEEYRLNMMKLQLAQREADDNYKLELMKLQAAKVQAGLSTGFKDVTKSLTSTPVGTGTQVASTSPVKSSINTATSPTTMSKVSGGLTTAMGAMSPARKRILASLGTKRIKNVQSRILPYGMIAQGSTRNVRQKGSSDLMDFQNSIQASGSRAIASNDTDYRHISRVQDLSAETHTSGRTRGIAR